MQTRFRGGRLHALAGWPIIGSGLRLGAQVQRITKAYRAPFGHAIRWLVKSREYTNWTYDLTDANKEYLASFVAVVSGCSVEDAARYIKELDGDSEARRHVAMVTNATDVDLGADAVARFGKRLGWYAFARALKPRVIVETGIDKGLGSVAFCAALLRNAAEGYPGRYYGLDIDPRTGYLLAGPYRRVGELVFGDAISTLRTFGREIDLYVNDSDHSADYEAAEYHVAQRWFTPDSVILGDNAHVTDKLYRFAQATGRRFLFFAERPKDHWYPGGGIGVAF